MISNQVLATFPFLCRLSAGSNRLFEASAKTILAHRGDTLLRRDDRIEGALLVLTGRLRVYAISASGDEATLYLLGAGEACPLAMNALLKDGRHQAWVRAETKVAKVLFIPKRAFRDLYQNEASVREFVLGVVAERISGLMTALEDLALHSLRERLERHLRTEADREGEVATTHQEIAFALGSAREVISRQLRELRREEKIEMRRGRIRILPLAARSDSPSPLAERSRRGLP